MKTTHKLCASCKTSLPVADFPVRSKSKDGLHAYCNECNRRKARDWARANKSRAATNARRHQLKQYGLTNEQYEDMLRKQGGGCALCGKKPDEEKRRLAVDHDHATGVVRGILCFPCNTCVGRLGDTEEKILHILRYIKGIKK